MKSPDEVQSDQSRTWKRDLKAKIEELEEDAELLNSMKTELLEKNVNDMSDIDNLYLSLVSIVNSATETYIPKSIFKPYIKQFILLIALF